jgi:hypothetical protein
LGEWNGHETTDTKHLYLVCIKRGTTKTLPERERPALSVVMPQ